MPNWCNNTITLTGPKDKVKKIFDEAKKEDCLLNLLYPMPSALEGTTSPAPKEGKVQPLVDGFDNWYDWRVQNWGSKWDVDTDNLEYREEDDQGIIQGWFDSAWAPPIHCYEHFLTNNETYFPAFLKGNTSPKQQNQFHCYLGKSRYTKDW